MAAETEEQARDAVRAIKVEYEVLPHVATEAQAMAEGAPEVFKGGNVRKGRSQTKGKPEEAMAKADVTIEGTYSVPMITHVCLEPHGLTVKWEGDRQDGRLGEHADRQGVAGELAETFEIPAANVTVLTDYMGGGFGSKFGADIWGATAAELRRRPAAGRSRCSSTASRSTWPRAIGPAPAAQIKLGATRDGKLVAMIAETHGTGGVGGGADVHLALCLQRSHHVA